ncbi:hypothetical protein [Sulfobacillus harzensis]|uniref:Uncharacterized protein n=1 Tax=Sulfobacillus harzensis TaxID=2729629 RepID=A0A7Y0Q1F7_9FIRM|nr:hypothetical protein [Sulfobacillus harzensis]NMP21290.1 hypothetical protein [Sulfobacillus harzensis]
MRWQNVAQQEWESRLAEHVEQGIRALLEPLPQAVRISWLRRLEHPAHPVAQGMARWLSMMDSRPWTVAPGDDWQVLEDNDGVLMSYPEALGFDPVAMSAFGALWADDRSERWQALVSRLGAMAIISAWEASIRSEGVLRRLQSFRSAYPALFDTLGAASGAGQPLKVNWPALPDFSAYQQQLAYGVVPHEAGGHGVDNEIAVLLALHMVGDADRPLMAGLAYKALEGRWLWEAWQKTR